MEWHKRYVQQAAWTKDLRAYLFNLAGKENARSILEVGCGTGAILSDLQTVATIFGLDKSHANLIEARQHIPRAGLASGEAMSLPFAGGVFDITFCHFLLLWVHDPLQAICEMKRVTRPGGSILALAEPDYDQRVDKPALLAPLGRWQAESLRRQEADPSLGGRLAQLFHQAGIPLIETGPMKEKAQRLSASDWELEWAVLDEDLAGLVPEEEIRRLQVLDKGAWERGERELHVPTYWAFGVKR